MSDVTRHVAALRAVTGVFAVSYLLVRAPELARGGAPDDASFRPVGVVELLRDAPLSSNVGWLVVAAVVALGVAFALGWRHRVTGPLFALGLLWVLTYRNSWSQVFHTENLLVLHVLVLGFLPAADRWSFDARRRGAPVVDEDRVELHRWMLRAIMVITVVAYVVAGVAKLRNSGLDWITGDHLRHWVAYDNLRKIEFGDVHSPIGGWLAGIPWVWPPIALLTMVVELGAPLALLGPRLARWWVVAAFAFHLGVLVLMAILFPYQLTGVAFAAFVPLDVWMTRAALVARRTRVLARA